MVPSNPSTDTFARCLGFSLFSMKGLKNWLRCCRWFIRRFYICFWLNFWHFFGLFLSCFDIYLGWCSRNCYANTWWCWSLRNVISRLLSVRTIFNWISWCRSTFTFLDDWWIRSDGRGLVIQFQEPRAFGFRWLFVLLFLFLACCETDWKIWG